MKFLRILSLLPAATEIVYLLGLEKYLVGTSDQVISSLVSNNMSSKQIDQSVKKLIHKGPGVFHIKEEVLKKLKPNLILTQELCEVCAVGFNQVKKAARILDGEVKIISLEPESVEDILDNIILVGELNGKNKESRLVVKGLKKRLEKLNSKFFILNSKKPKVLVIEWLDPIMVAGHWVPEMVEKAGGKMLITRPGEKSRQISVGDLKEVDILVISPCGFDIDRTIKERQLIVRVIQRLQGFQGRVYLMDGNAYLTRPGPRVIEGIEILGEVFHPDLFPRQHSKEDWTIFE